MLDRMKEKIELEITNIERLLEEYSPLLTLIKQKEPDAIEIAAIATVLHSFYNGVENTIKIILKSYQEQLPITSDWHIELLNLSIKSNEKRSSIISKNMQEHLIEYMKFRHTFRHMYSYQLNWEKMSHLIKKLEQVILQFIIEIREFIKKKRSKIKICKGGLITNPIQKVKRDK